MNKENLISISKNVRKNIIEMLCESKSGHPGGSLSCADILTYLYYEKMNIDVSNPKWEQRDRFVLSKGHAAPALYSVLAEKGFFPKEELKTLRKTGGLLQGHPDSKHVPGVDVSTGSLGQGISIVDFNGLQIDGKNEEVMGISPLDEKFRGFGFNVIECDGHDYEELDKAFKNAEETKGKPTVIIAKTVKGKGVSFMENQAGWHGQAPNKEQTEQAITEIMK